MFRRPANTTINDLCAYGVRGRATLDESWHCVIKTPTWEDSRSYAEEHGKLIEL
jgi:hypothetical protein